MTGLLAKAERIRQNIYHIEYKSRSRYEIVCPMYTFADRPDITVTPWFLARRRKYPIEVYLFACSLYSTNPGMGQRGVAEATRAKFKLEKFSHTTVGRVFKAFERSQKQALVQEPVEGTKPCSDEPPIAAGPVATGSAKTDEALRKQKRMASVMDTAARRKEMASFLQEYIHAAESGDTHAAARQFVKYWHEKTQKLLL